MTLRKLAAGSVISTALAIAATAAIAQTAVGPGGPFTTSLQSLQFSGSTLAASPRASDFGPLAADAEGRAILQKIEGKWGRLMREVMSWDANAFQQFYEGYKNYPLSVLNRALHADTYEAMDRELMAYPAAVAQRNAGLAFNFAKTKAADLTTDALELGKAAVKALGDDARDLIFVPTTPCTVWDTRFAIGAPFAGAIGNGVTREFYSHYSGGGGDFSPYGGNPSCTENNVNFLGARPYAVMMTVYVSNGTGNGWLTFYRDGDPDPSPATISVYYSAGPTRTQTVIAKSNRSYGSGTYDIAVTGRFSTADASASVVGYFLKPAATALDCQYTSSDMTAVPNNVYTTVLAQCPAGYTVTGGGNYTSDGTLGYQSVWVLSVPWAGNAWALVVNNQAGGPRSFQAWAVCCRVPGH
jgi:hypothetical protein